ncbi:RNA polymerase sigma factor [endosymbiont of unidentified scaly snail isolate Monju]|uniref:RNA polymerase sigma factor n=1 Tax=endosymbiont of unidentified scaly snail isolate Monju TaxID=1248727 RepID=UPI000389252B|nr:RNA polymerase sigma factor [endosymbiont of unidentified scaly snail isolate Monju]BAN70150.1 RNA polymerase sigma-70 factor, ECF subfamily [endosymbiont of unidentified scaly snail isolate Monju]
MREKNTPSLLERLGRTRRLRHAICEERERLYRLAWSWSHDQHMPEDLVQETLARALDKLDSLRDETRLAAWLTRIMANLFRDQFRRQREDTGQDAEPVTEETPEEAADRSQLVQHTREAIAALNDDHRQIITLVDLAGFSYADAAQILDVPVGTVMSRLSRARGRLRELLAQVHLNDRVVVPLRKRYSS